MPVVQIKLFISQFEFLFVGFFLGRTCWYAVKSSLDAGPDTEE